MTTLPPRVPKAFEARSHLGRLPTRCRYKLQAAAGESRAMVAGTSGHAAFPARRSWRVSPERKSSPGVLQSWKAPPSATPSPPYASPPASPPSSAEVPSVKMPLPKIGHGVVLCERQQPRCLSSRCLALIALVIFALSGALAGMAMMVATGAAEADAAALSPPPSVFSPPMPPTAALLTTQVRERASAHL